MTLPGTLSRLLEPCALSLAHSLWQGGLISLFTWAILKSIPARLAGVRYWLTVASLTAAVLAFFLTITFFASRQGPFPGEPSAPLAPAFIPQASQGTPAIAPLPNSSTPSPITFAPPAPVSALPSTPLSPAPSPAPLAPPTPTPPPSLWDTFLALRIPDPALPYIFTTWLLGALLMLLRSARAIHLGIRIKRSASPMNLGTEFDLFSLLARQMGVTTRTRIATSLHVTVPAVVGWFWPVVLLPARGLSALPPEDLKLILAHELAHIKRHDALIDFLQTLIESALFFNPGIWWLSTTIRTEREACCDAIAIRQTAAQPDQYACALVNWARLISTPQPGLAFATEPKNLLLHRVKRILLPDARPQLPGPWLALACLLLLISLFLTALPKPVTAQPKIQIAATQPVSGIPLDTLKELASQVQNRDAAYAKNFRILDQTVTLTLKTKDGEPLPADTQVELLPIENVFDWHNYKITVPRTGPATFSTVLNSNRLRGGAWKLFAKANGYYIQEFGPITPEPMSPATFEGVLTKAPPITIKTVDATNTPIPGAIVHIRGLSPMGIPGFSAPFVSWHRKLITDNQGGAQLLAYSRGLEMVMIAACTPDGQASAEEYPLKLAGPINLTLKPGKPQSGQIVDPATGAPIPNATIYVAEPNSLGGVWRTPENQDRFLKVATSDSEGRFTLTGFPKGSTWGNLCAVGPDGQTGYAQSSYKDEPLIIKAGMPVTIRGTVIGDLSRLTPIDGAPTLKATIAFLVDGNTSARQIQRVPVKSIAPNAGQFTLTAPVGSTILFHPRALQPWTDASNCVELPVTSPSPGAYIDLAKWFGPTRTPPDRTARLRFIGPDQKPIPGAKVVIPALMQDLDGSFQSQELTTNAQGIADITVRTPARLVVTGDVPGTTAHAAFHVTDIPAGAGIFPIDIPAFPVGTLIYQITDAYGKPTLGYELQPIPLSLPTGLKKLPDYAAGKIIIKDQFVALDNIPLNAQYQLSLNTFDNSGNRVSLGSITKIAFAPEDKIQSYHFTLDADKKLIKAQRTDKPGPLIEILPVTSSAPATKPSVPLSPPLPPSKPDPVFQANAQRWITVLPVETTLQQAVDQIAQDAQITIEMDWPGLAKLGFTPRDKVSHANQASIMPVRYAVLGILSAKPSKPYEPYRPLALDVIRVVELDDRIIVGPRDTILKATVKTQSFNVKPLLSRDSGKPIQADALIKLITQSIGNPADWQPSGFASIAPISDSGTLTVTAPVDFLSLVQPVLDQLAVTHQSTFIQTRTFSIKDLKFIGATYPSASVTDTLIRSTWLEASELRKRQVWSSDELATPFDPQPQITAQAGVLTVTAQLPDLVRMANNFGRKELYVPPTEADHALYRHIAAIWATPGAYALPGTGPRPLQDAIEQVFAGQQVAIDINWAALSAIGVTPQTSVTPPGAQPTRGGLLKTILDQVTPANQKHNRAYAWSGNKKISVSTRLRSAPDERITLILPIDDLASNPANPISPTQLLEKLKAKSPQDWLPGGIRDASIPRPGLLYVTMRPGDPEYFHSSAMFDIDDIRTANNLPRRFDPNPADSIKLAPAPDQAILRFEPIAAITHITTEGLITKVKTIAPDSSPSADLNGSIVYSADAPTHARIKNLLETLRNEAAVAPKAP